MSSFDIGTTIEITIQEKFKTVINRENTFKTDFKEVLLWDSAKYGAINDYEAKLPALLMTSEDDYEQGSNLENFVNINIEIFIRFQRKDIDVSYTDIYSRIKDAVHKVVMEDVTFGINEVVNTHIQSVTKPVYRQGNLKESESVVELIVTYILINPFEDVTC